jgi:NADH dehydrogenase
MSEHIKILIVGNGFGGTYALKNLNKLLCNDKRIELSLIGEKNYFLFTPLLHEIATGGINPVNILEPIRKVLGHCLKNFYLGKVESINLTNRTVEVDNVSISYDYLILAPGATTNFYDIQEAEKYCFTLKSIDDAIKLKNHCIMQMERASHTANKVERQKMLRFVVIGGGPTGVELVAGLQEFINETFSHYYTKEVIADASIILIERGGELLSSFGVKMRKKSMEVLMKKGIKVMLNTHVKEIKMSEIITENGTSIFTETAIWVAGIKPVELKFDIPISKSPDGRLIVNEFLQLESHAEIFAIGDIALFKQNDTPLPALAQVAEKEARHVAQNIKLLINKKKPKPFSYHHLGYLLSLGHFMALGEIANFTFGGRITWWIWRTVYLSKLISTRKKLEVAFDWTINLFSPRDISQI